VGMGSSWKCGSAEEVGILADEILCLKQSKS
jgi:hypothetical protein